MAFIAVAVELPTDFTLDADGFKNHAHVMVLAASDNFDSVIKDLFRTAVQGYYKKLFLVPALVKRGNALFESTSWLYNQSFGKAGDSDSSQAVREKFVAFYVTFDANRIANLAFQSHVH